MKNIIGAINLYFIEMVKDQKSKEELAYRLTMTVDERQEYTLPETNSFSDAFYVSLGSRFQDKPLQTLFIIAVFIVVVGLTVANLVTKLL